MTKWRGKFGLAWLLLGPMGAGAFGAGLNLPPFDPLWCPRTMAELALAHRDVVVRDGVNRRGGVGEIDPFEAARKNLKDAGDVPVGLMSNPLSLSSFKKDLEKTLGELESARLPAVPLRQFQTRWGLSDAQLVDILLPYRQYDTRFSRGLKQLIPDDQAQGLATWAKYRTFLDESPRLAERYDYYMANLGKLSVPEMVRELREGDPDITDLRVRHEIMAFHLRIEDRFEQPLKAAEVTALNRVLTDAGKKALPQGDITQLQALQHARDTGLDVAVAANAIGVTPQEAAFYFHYSGIANRNVDWQRTVETDDGRRMTEEAYLRELHARRLSTHAIAEELNEAYGRVTGTTPSPSDGNFRTSTSARGKLKNLGLTRDYSARKPGVVDPVYGLISENGELRMPGALALIRDRRLAGDSYAAIAERAGVTERTVRQFESMHSEDYATRLPSALRRFLDDPTATSPGTAGVSSVPDGPHRLLPPSLARATPVLPLNTEKAPEPGKQAGFDAFNLHFKTAADEWTISTGPAMTREMGLIRDKLELSPEHWTRLIGNMAASSGGVVRQAENNPNPAKAKEIRNARYRMYLTLQRALAIYNLKAEDAKKLDPKLLETEAGIKTVIETLRGEKLGAAYTKGRDATFDVFYDVYREGSTDWSFSQPSAWKKEGKKIREFLGLTDEQWAELGGNLKDGTRLAARLDETKQADDPDRLTTIRAGRYEVYQLLKKLIAHYNEKVAGDKPKLDPKQLENTEGIKTVLEALRGEAFVRPWAEGQTPTFDAFHDAFRESTARWNINREKWGAEVEKIRTHLGVSEADWSKAVGEVIPSWGQLASTEVGATKQDPKVIRSARYRVYNVLQKAIALYNTRNPNAAPLSVDQLKTPAGAQMVIETLRGEKLP